MGSILITTLPEAYHTGNKKQSNWLFAPGLMVDSVSVPNELDFLDQSSARCSLCYNGSCASIMEDGGEQMAEPTSGNQLAQQFQACRPAFCAIGDETRQLILRVFIENCGTRAISEWVGELQASTNLSRAAVSHHLKVLKDAGIITFRREGTKNYYYLDSASQQPAGCVGTAAGCRPADETLPDLSGRRRTQMRIYQILFSPTGGTKKAAAPFAEVFGRRSAPLT